MKRRKAPTGLRELMVAPSNLRSRVLKLIRDETRTQRMGGEGRIIAKMNSLVDPDIIKALYEASSAGVKVDLIVRGICRLRPGVKGLSENIRVVSIVDRFLEHSRIYFFRARGEEKIFLSSADWMPRNFYTRFEVAFPVNDPSLKSYIKDVVLTYGLADNVKAWILRPDGVWIRPERPADVSPVRSQFVFAELASKGYEGTSLFNRIPV
jgi:polyphosphate kinase